MAVKCSRDVDDNLPASQLSTPRLAAAQPLVASTGGGRPSSIARDPGLRAQPRPPRFRQPVDLRRALDRSAGELAAIDRDRRACDESGRVAAEGRRRHGPRRGEPTRPSGRSSTIGSALAARVRPRPSARRRSPEWPPRRRHGHDTNPIRPGRRARPPVSARIAHLLALYAPSTPKRRRDATLTITPPRVICRAAAWQPRWVRHVDLHDRFELRDGRVDRMRGGEDPGVVDRDVERPAPAHGLAREPPALLRFPRSARKLFKRAQWAELAPLAAAVAASSSRSASFSRPAYNVILSVGPRGGVREQLLDRHARRDEPEVHPPRRSRTASPSSRTRVLTGPRLSRSVAC
jgi:hypothetical protein